MKGPQFKSAMRSILDYLGEGLMWMGPMWMGSMWMGPPFDDVEEHPDESSMTPQSRAERAEWAALVDRLR